MSRPRRGRTRGGDDVAAHEVLDAFARARSRARDRGERFTDLYVWVFCGVLLAVWTLSFARETFTGRVCSAADGVGCVLQEHPAYVALAVALAGVGVLLLVAGSVGPVSAERAFARWMLSTSAERSVLLRGSVAGAVIGTALGGVVVGLLVSMAARGGDVEPGPAGVGALCGAAVGVLVPLVLVRPQAARPYGDAPGSRAGATLVAVGLGLLAWVLMEAPLADPVRVRVSPGAVYAAAMAALVVGLAVLVTTLRRGGVLAELSDAQLARGREVVDAVVDSTVMLDPAMVTGLQRRRADRVRGRHTSRRLTGRGAVAFLVADLRQVRRRWRSLVPAVLLVPGLLVVGEGFGYGGAALAAALGAAWVGRRTGQGLRVWLSSSGLRRTVRLPELAVTAALTVAPAVACTVVTVPTVVLVGGPWWAGIHLASAGLAATMRSADPVPLEVGAVVTTPAGALPTGLLTSTLHGPDLALVLGLALLLVSDPWVLVLSVAALTWQVTRQR